MASNTSLKRFILIFGLLLLIGATLIPIPVRADAAKNDSSLPDLPSFIQSVMNGDKSTARGVYVEGLFAMPIVQQPGYGSYYVSTKPNTVTEFGAASAYGNIGLLAHDFLAGKYFFQLSLGNKIQLIYGDGKIENFLVTHIYRYQATDPESVYSQFIDLDSQEILSSTKLFKEVYMGAQHITFQTCITENENASWGRLFVIAEPAN